MKKIFIKLIAITLSTAITLIVVVAASYAWLNMSTAPSVAGLQISIGAKNTILVAPDVTQTVDGETVHYPGMFSDTLNFSKVGGYDYLREIVDMTPVSTADGIHWYFPGLAESGEQASQDEYLLDNTLKFGNATELPDDNSVQGGYAYLDFWVVSPTPCRLRVSAGKGDGGSYLVSLPQPTADEDGGYTLDTSTLQTASCARVGFLANDETITDQSMNRYVQSGNYREQYRYLKGIYQEKGTEWNCYPARFTIYEPNADRHKQSGVYTLSRDGLEYILCPDGSYINTLPIGNVNGVAQPVDVSQHTTVQKATDWLSSADGDSQLEQMFQAYLRGSHTAEIAGMADEFYREYLGYQCGTLLNKGAFIKRSEDLMGAADDNGIVQPQLLAGLSTAGATDDVVIIDLEKNVPQRIRMFVWIEGRDADCANIKAGGGLLLNLELAGGSN